MLRLARWLLRAEISREVLGAYIKGHGDGYDIGISRGYELGWQSRKSEETNKGFIIGSRVNQQISEIMEKNNG